MKGSLYIGSVRGIKMYIHWTFTLLIIWIAGSHFFEGGSGSELGRQLIFVFAVFGCVLLHELGHALSALRYGINTHDITLLPIGGVARLERIPEKPAQELVVAAAGPAVNVVIALILYLILAISGTIPDAVNADTISNGGFALSLLVVNISLVLFNLIPAFPMDGGRMLRALLGMKMKRAKATRYAAGLGQLLAIGFIFYGFFFNPVLMFIGLFIFMGARQEASHVSRTEMLKEVKASDLMLTEFRTLYPDNSLRIAIQHLLSTEQTDFPVISHEGNLTGILTHEKLLRAVSEQGLDTTVDQVATEVPFAVKPEEEAMPVYGRMMDSAVSSVPVIKDGKLAGILTLTNIREYFLVKHAMEIRHSRQNSKE